MVEKQLGTRGKPRPGDKERGAQGPIEPESASFSGLVETEESLTLEMAPLVVDALRDLSEALARLVDTLDEDSSN